MLILLELQVVLTFVMCCSFFLVVAVHYVLFDLSVIISYFSEKLLNFELGGVDALCVADFVF